MKKGDRSILISILKRAPGVVMSLALLELLICAGVWDGLLGLTWVF